jgi:uncharacterized protein YbjQ (UPF0145 family)
MIEFWQQVLFFCGLLLLGYLIGSYLEKKHYKSIRQREEQTRLIPIVTFGAKQLLPPAEEAMLFVGVVVISVDFFKMISAALRGVVGGKMVVYESLLDRARREALLRMKEQAIAWGATQILNVRFETATIGGRSGDNKGIGSVEVIVYGTGIR